MILDLAESTHTTQDRVLRGLRRATVSSGHGARLAYGLASNTELRQATKSTNRTKIQSTTILSTKSDANTSREPLGTLLTPNTPCRGLQQNLKIRWHEHGLETCLQTMFVPLRHHVPPGAGTGTSTPRPPTVLHPAQMD